MKKLLFLFIVLILSLSSTYFVSKYTKKTHIPETLISIKKNSSVKDIANLLYKEKIINSPTLFYLYVRIKGYERKMQAGTYLFKGDLSLVDIIKIIEKGKVYLKKITFPEGWTYKKIAKRLSSNKLANYKKFIALCENKNFVKQVTTFSKPTIEGFLYPDTYYFPEGVSEKFIIKKMVENFYKHTAQLDFKPDFILNFYQTVIMASIVERESGLDSEKPLIAGVYIKRYLKGYKLQADPTVAYALELKGKRRRKLYYKDLEIDSPYNTYLYKGLPPTPISNPSISTIKAVLNYEPTDYLFFFANEGKHIFSKNYKAHLRKQNIIKYNR